MEQIPKPEINQNTHPKIFAFMKTVGIDEMEMNEFPSLLLDAWSVYKEGSTMPDFEIEYFPGDSSESPLSTDLVMRDPTGYLSAIMPYRYNYLVTSMPLYLDFGTLLLAETSCRALWVELLFHLEEVEPAFYEAVERVAGVREEPDNRLAEYAKEIKAQRLLDTNVQLSDVITKTSKKIGLASAIVYLYAERLNVIEQLNRRNEVSRTMLNVVRNQLQAFLPILTVNPVQIAAVIQLNASIRRLTYESKRLQAEDLSIPLWKIVSKIHDKRYG